MSFVRKPLIMPLAVPAAILLAAALSAPLFAEASAELKLGLRQLPYYLLVLVSVLALFLHRAREAGAGLLLILIYYTVQTQLQAPLAEPRPGSVYFLLSLFVPLILGVLAVVPEKRNTELWGMVAILVVPVSFLLAMLILRLAPELHQVWLPRVEAPTILSAEGFYLFAAAILLCLLAFIVRRESSQVSVLFAGVFAFATLNWLHLPMISTVMMVCASLSLFVGCISSLLSMLYRDELTGLHNRKAFNREMEVLKPGDVLVMADIDKFKALNDTHGHDTGDEVLKLVAALLSEVRERGKTFRYGGEEFSFVFRGREPLKVVEALQEVRKKVAAYPIALRNHSARHGSGKSGASYRKDTPAKKTIHTSISMGVVSLREGELPRDALHRADTQLYRAKESGRNCICSSLR